MNLLSTNAICAIITPPGNSILGGVRISGDNTLEIAEKIFIPENSHNFHFNQRQATRGKVKAKFHLDENEIICESEAVIYIYPAPHSYTCEDVVEIFTSGTPPLLNAIIRNITDNGARLAEAGEFTLRAFLNGRLSLGEAEAVERIIRAETESERQDAVNRLTGEIERKIADWRQELLYLAGTIESIIDFEDEDIDEDLETNLSQRLIEVAKSAEKLAESAAFHNPENNSGIRIILAGLTNAGKSSILNALFAENRAIISHERSTTRDHTEHTLAIKGIDFIIEDCPGIDLEDTLIAASTTQRAKTRFLTSTTLLLIIDQSDNDLNGINELIAHIPHCRVIVVLNKNDLPEKLNTIIPLEKLSQQSIVVDVIKVSAITGDGIEKLKNIIYNEALIDSSTNSGISLSTREAEELKTAAKHAKAGVEVLAMGAELAAVELREAYEALARLGGEGYAEDILSNVFSRFCIGK